jgi:glycerol uptake facilitator-like aquaporin
MRSKYLAEFFGSFFLLMMIVGSGVMAERLASGNEALALLCNSLATGFGLFVVIRTLAPVSGAHFNPCVSLLKKLAGEISTVEFFGYILAQIPGAILGVLAVHGMFGLEVLQVSTHERNGFNLGLSEFFATFGLMFVVLSGSSRKDESLPVLVSCFVMSAYWFTSSTAFANPAVTLARAFTDTFCGIAPKSLPAFFLAQMTGAILAFLVFRRMKRSF